MATPSEGALTPEQTKLLCSWQALRQALPASKHEEQMLAFKNEMSTSNVLPARPPAFPNEDEQVILIKSAEISS
jgi:hypothetical protein